jgi:alanine racemase
LVSTGTQVMAVVKADGYGHGAIEIAAEAVRSGASHLGVATVSEGLQLRAAGVSVPILILGPIDPTEVRTALERRLSLAIGDRRFAELVDRVASGCGLAAARVHLKVDTGMHRFGVAPSDVVAAARSIHAADALAFEGVFTHFADADGVDEAPTAAQAELFEDIVAHLAGEGIRPRMVHAANSAATLRWRRYDYDLVRIGIAVYGLPPARGFPMPPELRPALRVTSSVARVVVLNEGDGVSYGFTYRARHAHRAALVPIGYADGYPRALSNRGWMFVGAARAPVLGRICMDQTVVGLAPAGNVRVGDRVDVIGGSGPSLEEAAEAAGTITYEVAVGLARRMPRTYVRGTHPMDD